KLQVGLGPIARAGRLQVDGRFVHCPEDSPAPGPTGTLGFLRSPVLVRLSIDVSHAIASYEYRGVDGIRDLMGLLAESAGKLRHAHKGAAGKLRGLVIAEVGEARGRRCDP